jgi:pyridoxal phosphate-dependent aminotransferase EpsN
MNDSEIFLSPPTITIKEKEYVLDALNSNWLAPNGPFVKKFETLIAQRLMSSFCIATQSGTSALHLILSFLQLKPNEVVFCPTHSFVASANPIVYSQAIPFFIDCESESFGMDADLLELAIHETLNKKLIPKAVIVTHLYGMPAIHLFRIKELCTKYQLVLIEDAAESLGSNLNNHPIGSIGDYGMLSFNSNKIITTGGGGAVITNKNSAEKMMRLLANQGKENYWYYKHTEIGYNYLMSNIPAAIGCAQIEQLDAFIEKRKKIHLWYAQYLNASYSIHQSIIGESNYWLCLMKIKNGYSVQKLLAFLKEKNIDARAIWKSLHSQPIFSKALNKINNTSDTLFHTHILLPTGNDLTEEQVQYICNHINNFKV